MKKKPEALLRKALSEYPTLLEKRVVIINRHIANYLELNRDCHRDLERNEKFQYQKDDYRRSMMLYAAACGVQNLNNSIKKVYGKGILEMGRVDDMSDEMLLQVVRAYAKLVKKSDILPKRKEA